MNNQFGKVDLSKFKIKINNKELQQYYKEKYGTKFKVGDIVHIIESVEDENGVQWIYSGKGKIEAVIIVWIKLLCTLRYKLDCLDAVLEKNIFRTEKKARKECERRNK